MNRKKTIYIPCISWRVAAQQAFRTGRAPIRINGRWLIREAV